MRPGTALLWSLVNTGSARLGTLAVGIVLARLLGPEEFGVFAVALVALMAVLSFNELGVSLAIVRWREDPAGIAPTVTTISTASSTLLMLGAMAAAGPFANLMGAPEAAPLVRLLSVCILVNGVVATPAALIQRAFRQDQRMVVDQVNVWLGAAVSLVAALLGLGAMSLVVGRLTGALVSGVLMLHYSPQPLRFGWDRGVARHLLHFGLPLAGASVVVFLVSFLDQLMVGSLLGPVQLGFYVLAFNLASWPVALFSQPLRSVAPAMFARMQDDPDALRRGFVQVLRPVAVVAFPVCAAIAVTAPELIRFVYGKQWDAAAPVLRWLALLAALRIVFELSYDYLVVRRRTGAILTIQVVWLILLVPAMWVGVGQGPAGAALALAVVSLLVSTPMYLRELARLGVTPGPVLRAVLLPSALGLSAAALAGACVHVVSSTFSGLALAGTLVGAVCAAGLWAVREDAAVFRKGTA